MNDVHKELELIVGNTDWENKYRQVIKAVADYPLEDVKRLVNSSSEGLSPCELDVVRSCFLSYEQIVEDYSLIKANFPAASEKAAKIRKEMEFEKERLAGIVGKIYENFKGGDGEIKYRLAETYSVFYEIAKRNNKLPWFSGEKLSEVASFIEEVKRKKIENFEKEKEIVDAEIKRIHKFIKERNYSAMKNCEYVVTKNHFEEYDSIFENMKEIYFRNELSLKEKEKQAFDEYIKKLQIEIERDKIFIEKTRVKAERESLRGCAKKLEVSGCQKKFFTSKKKMDAILNSEELLSVGKISSLKEIIDEIIRESDFKEGYILLNKVKKDVKKRYCFDASKMEEFIDSLNERLSDDERTSALQTLVDYKCRKQAWDCVLNAFKKRK